MCPLSFSQIMLPSIYHTIYPSPLNIIKKTDQGLAPLLTVGMELDIIKSLLDPVCRQESKGSAHPDCLPCSQWVVPQMNSQAVDHCPATHALRRKRCKEDL